ncbi:MAG: hypothetical protein N838_27295 [Thiohalocapsa sp. PB-PSB1]|nr:MAG: hypothetical protein N838_11820 [Thiohalocapsa sp. PB-PSB1]QQO56520.1 MAG: hypothetical protein N838_27295 [Thiohalocapsa sp. PB-PSB1]
MTIHAADNPIWVRFPGFRERELALKLRAYIRTTAYSQSFAVQVDVML